MKKIDEVYIDVKVKTSIWPWKKTTIIATIFCLPSQDLGSHYLVRGDSIEITGEGIDDAKIILRYDPNLMIFDSTTPIKASLVARGLQNSSEGK